MKNSATTGLKSRTVRHSPKPIPGLHQHNRRQRCGRAKRCFLPSLVAASRKKPHFLPSFPRKPLISRIFTLPHIYRAKNFFSFRPTGDLPVPVLSLQFENLSDHPFLRKSSPHAQIFVHAYTTIFREFPMQHPPTQQLRTIFTKSQSTFPCTNLPSSLFISGELETAVSVLPVPLCPSSSKKLLAFRPETFAPLQPALPRPPGERSDRPDLKKAFPLNPPLS